MSRVLVFHPSQSDCYGALLRQAPAASALEVVTASDTDGVLAALPATEILVAANTFPTDTLADARALRWIHVQGAGVDRWMEAPLAPSVRITRTVGSFGPRMAEYAMAHVLAVHQAVHAYRLEQQQRRWRAHDTVTLAGKRLGIAGIGAIGSALAERARAFGMDVVGLARNARTTGPYRVFGQDHLTAFLADLDVVVNILPLTRDTQRMFNAAAFEQMPSHAWFVNMGRGGTVDEPALIEALHHGTIAGAILDVFEEEPLAATSPLWSQPNVIITPHIAGTSIPEEVVNAFFDNLPRFEAGHPMLDEVERTRAY